MAERRRILTLGLQLAVRAGGWRVPVILACGLALAVQPPASAVAMKALTDGALAGDRAAVILAVATLAGLIALIFSAYGISVPLQTTVSERAARIFEQDLMRLVTSIPTLEPHERPDVADRVHVVRANPGMLIETLWTAVAAVVFVIGAGIGLALLGRTDPVLLVLPVFSLPLLAASVYRLTVRERSIERTAEPLRRAAHLYHVATTMPFAKELRLSRLEGEIADRYGRESRAADRELFMADRRAGLIVAGAWAVFATAWVTAVGMVAGDARAGTATPGDVVLAVGVAGLVHGYVSGAAGLFRNLGQALAMARRYLWLVRLAESTPVVHGSAPARLADGIELDGVCFTYPGTDVEVLHDVSLTLPSGSTVGIVGDNGAGKTTVAKLLCGLYRPTRGRILVDGADLAGIRPTGWSERLAGAFQDFARPELLVREAIGVGDLPRRDEPDALARALDRAGTVPTDLPALDQQLGRAWDGGVDVSGGQWQQLAMARGMMRDQPVVRVLDEPTASLDADVEHALFARFGAAAHEGSTAGGVTVVVSHRFGTVRMMDLILVVDGGRVVEHGHHEDLMSQDGLYAELYRLQARAYE